MLCLRPRAYICVAIEDTDIRCGTHYSPLFPKYGFTSPVNKRDGLALVSLYDTKLSRNAPLLQVHDSGVSPHHVLLIHMSRISFVWKVSKVKPGIANKHFVCNWIFLEGHHPRTHLIGVLLACPFWFCAFSQNYIYFYCSLRFHTVQ